MMPDTSSRVHVLGVPVDVLGMNDVLRIMERWIVEGSPCRSIALTNSHGIIEGRRRPLFKTILKSADLSLPDGRWTARAVARKAGSPTSQIRGADLLWEFCRLAERKGFSNFFYGDTEETLAQCRRRLLAHFPRLRIAGSYSPPFRVLTPQEEARAVETINAASPDVVWVALGLPKQEQWIYDHRSKLHASVAVAVGAAVKFASGNVRSAPEWAIRSGFEWLWRLIQEPRKVWRRALIYGPQFAAHALLDVYGLRRYE
ncbi:MAG TPA: WecB/TagA/CpsF family glycosyltransferase [Candidatus Dormibacteraeota bacterium]|nr:WecB/TagA/CpsF family glycosyltransferase [Candidatus Dormibacteraeota bacterium]